jgi:hypothetical protein
MIREKSRRILMGERDRVMRKMIHDIDRTGALM